ncbi:MAG: 16S rRNA (cytidine(1402)-2'-O)-methyltransferase [Rhodospirillales bacterium]
MAQSGKKRGDKTHLKNSTKAGSGEVATSVSRSADAGRNTEDGSRLPGASKPQQGLERGLYIVATPIGNAADITLRAIDVLRRADAIACEDTRVTGKLLHIHGIDHGRLISYHEHNAERAGARIMEHLDQGEIVALVSDAGTPMINDPGYRVAELSREAGHNVHAVPGPSAVTNALVLAGLPTDCFMYCGFPPPKQGKRRTWLGGFAAIDATLVFLESPQRLAASLADMADIFGPRPARVLREMTKMFEEVRPGTLVDLAAYYQDAGPPKGEVTLVVGGPDGDSAPSEDDIEARLRQALETDSVREAAARIAAETGLPRRELYNRALAIKGKDEP